MSRFTRWIRGVRSDGRDPQSQAPGRSAAAPKQPPRNERPPAEDIQVGRYIVDPPINAEVDVDEEARSLLFSHLAGVWRRMGEEEPYESVLYSPIFRMNKIEEHKSIFYLTADHDIQMIKSFFARAGKTLSDVKSALEVGCGVGRVTARLAYNFEKVVAVDISPKHLWLAKEHTGMLGLKNIEFHQIKKPEDFETLPGCDLIFSSIVLQHNPPPLIAWILSTLLSRLKPRGYCLFQVPTYARGYDFTVSRYMDLARGKWVDGYEYNAARYVDSPTASIDMHVLPQKEIFSIFRQHGIDVLEVAEDRAAGAQYRSNVFFGQKSGPVQTKSDIFD
jgi:SAM-dependent methyltransferase